MEKDLEITENLQIFASSPPFSKQPELWSELIIEDQPYIQADPTGTCRNYKLHKIQSVLHGIAIGRGIRVHLVGPKKARMDLGICSGNYALNKTLSIEYCAQKLGAEFTEVEPSLRNHVADTVMLAYWVISKTPGVKVINNDTAQNGVWVPPKRWTNVKTFRGCTTSPSSCQKRRGRPAKKACPDEPSEQVREQPGQSEQTVGSS